MPFTTLIDSGIVAKHLDDPSWAIVDCRFKLDDSSWGEREYRTSHIPGAVFANLDSDLSGPRTGANGRHPLPDAGELSKTLGRWGIDATTQVVAYDQGAGMYASRLWWLLRWLGHDAAAVLNGGFAHWLAEKQRLSTGTESRSERTVHADATRQLHRWFGRGRRPREEDRLAASRRPHARAVSRRGRAGRSCGGPHSWRGESSVPGERR